MIIPNIFIGGTKAKAEEVNENFLACKEAIDEVTSSSGDTAATIEKYINFNDLLYYQSLTITDATWATPIVITSQNHGLTGSRKGHIKDIGGNTAANGTWDITVLDEDTFSLNDSKGNGLYTAGGSFHLFPESSEDLATKLFVEKMSEKANPFSIVSGNVDNLGKADLFAALVKTAVLVPTMTSAAVGGYTATGYYRVFDKNNHTEINGVSVYGTLTFPAPIYVTNIYLGTYGNSYYIATSSYINLYKDGVKVYSQKINPRSQAGTSLTIPNIECDKIERTAGSGSTWSGEGGGNAMPGCEISGYTLSGSGANTVVKFKVGGDYSNLKLCYANKEIEELQKLDNISGLPNGTNYILKIKGENDAITTTNSVTQGLVFPTSPADGDYFCCTAKGLETYKYTSGAWAKTMFVRIGEAVVSAGVITSIKSYSFDDSGYTPNKDTVAKMSMPSNSYVDIALNVTGSTYTVPSNGYVVLDKAGVTAGQYAIITNLTAGVGACTGYTPASARAICNVPVKAGDIVQYWYTLTGATNAFRFVYAEGSKP